VGVLLFLGPGWRAPAQDAAVVPAVPVPTAPEAAAVAVPEAGRESEAETIRRCLADAGSDDVRLRRRAVLILGKYRDPAAVAAVVACLRDPDDEVRRSAAVAISEWDVIPKSAHAGILHLVADRNVHVRRVASSMLPDLLGGRPALEDALGPLPGAMVVMGPSRVVIQEGVPITAEIGPPPGVAAGPAVSVPPTAALPSPAELAGCLSQALRDDDATVRRNVLTATRYRPGLLTRAALEPLVRDPEREIRILAVQAFGLLRGEEAARGAVLAAAAADTDATVRREVARALGCVGGAGFPGLEKLAGDADPGVRLQAVQELVQMQHPQGLQYLERCALDEAVPADERRDLLVYAGFYGEQAKTLYTRLSTATSALLRAEAIRGLARLQGEKDGNPGFLLPCLEDESEEVRRTAAQGLLRWANSARAQGAGVPWPTAADVARLQTSRYADVRLLAVHLTDLLPPEARLGALTDACLDDDTPVRCAAILNLALLGSPEALDLVGRSLDDPQPEVVMAAVRALAVRPSAQSRAQLLAFHNRCPDPSLKAVVAAVLADMEGGGPVRLRPSVRPPSRGANASPQRLRRPSRIPGPAPVAP